MTIGKSYLFGAVKSLCAILTVLAAVLASRSVSFVYASHTGVPAAVRIDSINGQDPASISCPANPLSNPVTIVGSGEGSAPPGRVEQYGVSINWGDGSPTELAAATFTPPTGRHVDFTYVFQTSPHVYADGAYTITISLFHTETAGSDNQIDATVTFNVCTFTPSTPTLQVDLINGQAPGSFSCPDSPVPNPVKIAGSGQGSAPPGSVEDYGVVIDWGDGSPAEETTATFTPSSGSSVNFTYVFESPEHSYAQSGNYTVSMALVYANPSGPGDLIAVTQTVDVCAFSPVAPTLQVDLLNGQDPTGFSCPDNPPTNPITITGSGAGSAPPGSVEEYGVIINWGDGSPVEDAVVTFTPASGTLVNFTYSFVTPGHTYALAGSYTVSMSLVYPDPSGSGDQIAATATIDVCIVLPKGTVTGEVTDATTGLPIYGGIVEDITDEIPILGSFPGGSVYVVQPPPGLRTIRVRADGWQDGTAQVVVTEDEVSIRNFVLTQVPTNLNVVGAMLPIGANGDKLFLVPECVEAVVNDEVVQVTCAHAGHIYFFVGLPDGPTTFRGINSFYDVGSATVNLADSSTGTRDQLPYKQVRLPVSIPEAQTRVATITGGVTGVTGDGVSPIATSVFATFDFEGVPVTVTTSSGSNGVYVIDLIPPGAAEIYANAAGSSLRSPVASTNIVGGVFVTQNLTVFPFDAETENFVPVVTSPVEINTDEDFDVLLAIDDFSVTDLNDSFSAEHTLQVYPGFNYTLADNQQVSIQVNPDPNFSGILTVPVTVSDGTNTSAPFNLTVSVNEVPDPIVYVDFDVGLAAGAGGEGTAASPFKTVGDALNVVSPAGTVLIKGLVTSTEPLFVMNQSVTLVNNNAGGEVVIIDPSLASQNQTTTTAQTGFVSRSSGNE